MQLAAAFFVKLDSLNSFRGIFEFVSSRLLCERKYSASTETDCQTASSRNKSKEPKSLPILIYTLSYKR